MSRQRFLCFLLFSCSVHRFRSLRCSALFRWTHLFSMNKIPMCAKHKNQTSNCLKRVVEKNHYASRSPCSRAFILLSECSPHHIDYCYHLLCILAMCLNGKQSRNAHYVSIAIERAISGLPKRLTV